MFKKERPDFFVPQAEPVYDKSADMQRWRCDSCLEPFAWKMGRVSTNLNHLFVGSAIMMYEPFDSWVRPGMNWQDALREIMRRHLEHHIARCGVLFCKRPFMHPGEHGHLSLSDNWFGQTNHARDEYLEMLARIAPETYHAVFGPEYD